MIPRYARPEMSDIWTDKTRWETILAVELAAAEAQARRGIMDKEAVALLKRKARVKVGRILEIERSPSTTSSPS